MRHQFVNENVAVLLSVFLILFNGSEDKHNAVIGRLHIHTISQSHLGLSGTIVNKAKVIDTFGIHFTLNGRIKKKISLLKW